MHIPPRFSAARVIFHPAISFLNIPKTDHAWVWQDLDSMGEMLQKSPLKQEMDALDPRVQIEFYPHQLQAQMWEGNMLSHQAIITPLTDDGQPRCDLKTLKVVRNFSGVATVLESLPVFLNHVLSAARLTHRTITQSIKFKRDQ